MTNQEFKYILEKAIAGDNKSIETILLLYMPLVDRHCYVNGQLDEDMKQYILIHIVKTISKFVV